MRYVLQVDRRAAGMDRHDAAVSVNIALIAARGV